MNISLFFVSFIHLVAHNQFGHAIALSQVFLFILLPTVHDFEKYLLISSSSN